MLLFFGILFIVTGLIIRYRVGKRQFDRRRQGDYPKTYKQLLFRRWGSNGLLFLYYFFLIVGLFTVVLYLCDLK